MVGGANIKIEWSAPQPVMTKNGRMWMRSWTIPEEHQTKFFEFWGRSKETMRGKGFSVGKTRNGNGWALNEWQRSIKDFKLTESKPVINYTNIPSVSSLPEYVVVNPNGLKDWQRPVVSRLCASILRHGSALDGSDTGCHAKGQKILMFDGTDKLVENISVGDTVMGWDGTPRKVLSLFRGNEMMYKVIPTKGDPFIVNKNHILTTTLTRSARGWVSVGEERRVDGEIFDIKVSDYLGSSKTAKHCMKLFSVGVDCWKERNLPIPPYLLGLLLGDGGMTSRSMVTLTSADKEIWEYVEKYQYSHGGILGSTNEDITKRFTSSPDLFKSLRELGIFPINCHDKFIPHEYKTSSREQRMELLAGLIDTDGWKGGCGGMEFCSVSEKLANDFVFLARSLGFFTVLKKRRTTWVYKGERKYGSCYRVSFTGECDTIPLKLKRKIPEKRTIKKRHNITGFQIEEVGLDDFYGFSIEGDGRYLLGDFIVTHNSGKTYSAIAACRELGMKIGVVCPKSVISSWKKVITKHFGLNYEFVLNYESVKTGNHKEIGEWVFKNRTSTVPTFVWNIPKDTLIIFDESHRLKGHETKNSEIALAAKDQGFKILCCSATNAIDPVELRTVGILLGLYKKGGWKKFAEAHDCEYGDFGWRFSGNKSVLKKLHYDIFLERGFRLKKDEIPGFPECDTFAEAFDVDEDVRNNINNVYAEMKKELLLHSAIEKSTQKENINHLTIQLRARQKAELLKVPLFVEMIEDSVEDGMSVAVFLNFSDTIRALMKRLKTKCVIWGENKGTERDDNIDAFQRDEQRVILINSAAGGTGVSLHDLNGNYPRVSIISPHPSAVILKQCLGRIHRAGAKTKALQKIVFAAGTIEEEVCDILKRKIHNMDLINDGDLSPQTIFEKKNIVARTSETDTIETLINQ